MISEQPLLKRELDAIFAGFKKLFSIGDRIIISGDCVYPIVTDEEDADVAAINGVTFVRSFIPNDILEERVYITPKSLVEELITAEQVEKPVIKELVYYEEKLYLVLNDIKVELLLPIEMTEIQYGKSYYSNFDQCVALSDCIDDKKCFARELSYKELDDIRHSRPVTLDTELGKVRISRNLLLLSGPIRKTGPIPFSVKWAVHLVPIEHTTEFNCVLSLHVNYAKMEAIHMYSVIPF